MTLRFTGRYRDVVRPPAGGSRTSPRRFNRVVHRGIDLVAGLLAGEPRLTGLLYWAVGEGDPAWDDRPEPPRPAATSRRLTREIHRLRLDPGRDLAFDPETQELVVRTTFLPGDGTGTWRELGLFGGDASPRPDSGYLVSHATHPRLDKGPDDTVERELLLSLTSDSMPASGLALVLRLLAREPGLTGLGYWALGAGDPAWDAVPPEPDPAAVALTAEVLRRPLARREMSYDGSTRTLVARFEADYDEAAAVLREVGLFGGDATIAADSGQLVARQIHPALDKTLPMVLAREVRLTLGAGATVVVPDLAGRSREEAAAALVAVELVLGSVEEVEGEGDDGGVTGQSPAAGSRVAEGTEVAVTLAVAPRVEVPHLTGLSAADAAAALAALGLVLAAAPATAESPAPAGTVLAQDPAAGTRIAAGGAVAVTLAVPVTVVVPDLAGLFPGEAVAALAPSSLALSSPPHATREMEPRADAVRLGTVIDQSPAAGGRAAVGSSVTVTLAIPRGVELPDLAGLDLDAAAAALRRAAAPLLAELRLPEDPPGLALGEVLQVEDPAEAGTLIGQEPTASGRLPLYGTVTVRVASPITGEVPNLTGLELAAARAGLETAGLVLGQTRRRQDPELVDRVVAQEPAAGSAVPRGSAVDAILGEPLLVTVPELVGHAVEFAQEALTGRRLVLGEVRTRVAGDESGVVEQKPAAGRLVPVDSAVSLVVAGGVPDVVDLRPNPARARLGDAGMELVGPPFEAEISDRPAGVVLRQRPSAGSAAAPGSAVTVVLSARVPEVTGLALDEAERRLVAVALAVGPVERQESERPGGEVLAQDPPPGAPARVGDQVRLSVAVAARVVVPEVTGRAVDEARRLLDEAGLLLELAGGREDPGPPDRIIEQRPPAGRRVARGSAVRAVVSVPRIVEVPAILRFPVEEAEPLLAEQGLGMRVVGKEESDLPPDTVLAQDPPPQTRVPAGTAVEVTVAVARTVVVPSVLGISVERAASLLADLSLGLERAGIEPSDKPAGTVLGQDPAPGRRVSVGTVVRITVARPERQEELPVVRAIWPPNGMDLTSGGRPTLFVPQILRWLGQWLARPRLEITFSRPMASGQLAEPENWLRVWQIIDSRLLTLVQPVKLRFGGTVDPVLEVEGVTYSFHFAGDAPVLPFSRRFLVQVRSEDGNIGDRELTPLDADYAGTRLPREILDGVWRLRDEERFPPRAWDGLVDSDLKLPSGDGRPGGILHAWFEIHAGDSD